MTLLPRSMVCRGEVGVLFEDGVLQLKSGELRSADGEIPSEEEDSIVDGMNVKLEDGEASLDPLDVDGRGPPKTSEISS